MNQVDVDLIREAYSKVMGYPKDVQQRAEALYSCLTEDKLALMRDNPTHFVKTYLGF